MDKSVRAEIEFVNALLLDLFESTAERFHKRGELWDEKTSRVCEKLMPISNTRQLQRSLPSDERPVGRLRDEGLLLYMQHSEVDKGEKALPVLDMGWDFTLNRYKHPIIRFRFFLLHWDGDGQIRAVGFRLETPEGEGRDAEIPGSHDYWHAQMITELEAEDNLLEKLIDPLRFWIPTKQPAFPVPARKLGDLLVVLLVSVYGMRQLSALIQSFKSSSSMALKKRLKEMRIYEK